MLMFRLLFFSYLSLAVPEIIVSIVGGVIVINTGTTTSALIFGAVAVSIGMLFMVVGINEYTTAPKATVIQEGGVELNMKQSNKGDSRTPRRRTPRINHHVVDV